MAKINHDAFIAKRQEIAGRIKKRSVQTAMTRMIRDYNDLLTKEAEKAETKAETKATKKEEGK